MTMRAHGSASDLSRGSPKFMLSENDIKAELSYAYLHAVCAHAGFGCSVAYRHLDNAGVDAQVDIRERLHPKARFTTFHLHFQLKATSGPLPVAAGRCSYPLEVPHYDKLRDPKIVVPRFLAIFHLPPATEDWLNVGPEQLVARRCARWVSLRDAPATENDKSINVHVPVSNLLTPESLRQIAAHASLGKDFVYGE
jgi:hypothetical protein